MDAAHNRTQLFAASQMAEPRADLDRVEAVPGAEGEPVWLKEVAC